MAYLSNAQLAEATRTLMQYAKIPTVESRKLSDGILRAIQPTLRYLATDIVRRFGLRNCDVDSATSGYWELLRSRSQSSEGSSLITDQTPYFFMCCVVGSLWEAKEWRRGRRCRRQVLVGIPFEEIHHGLPPRVGNLPHSVVVALRQLSPMQRKAVRLRYLDEVSDADGARKLRRTPQQYDILVRHGIYRLQKLLHVDLATTPLSSSEIPPTAA